MVASFLFWKKVMQLAHKSFQSLTQWQSIAIDLHSAPYALSLCPRGNQHCQKSLENLLIGKTEIFRDENCSPQSTSTDVDQGKCIAWPLRSAQPFLFPASFATSTLEQPFFFPFFFKGGLAESKKKDNKMKSSLIPVSVLWMVCFCLVWIRIDFCRSGERSVAIHGPPTYARCLKDHSRGTCTFFFSFFFFWRQTLVALFWLFIIQTNISSSVR